MLRLATLIAIALLGLFALSEVNNASAQTATRICVAGIGPNGQLNCVEGWLPKLLNGLTNSATSVKSSNQAVLGTIYCYNPSNAVAYIQLFDVATAAGVTLGTTVPKLSLGVPTAQASGTGPTAVGILFYNGLQVAATTTATGSTAPSTAMDCSVTYD